MTQTLRTVAEALGTHSRSYKGPQCSMNDDLRQRLKRGYPLRVEEVELLREAATHALVECCDDCRALLRAQLLREEHRPD